MGNIEALLQTDVKTFLVTLFVIIFGIITIIEAIGKISEYIGKPLHWIKNRQTDHILLKSTVEEVKELKKQHEEAVLQSIRHDKMIKNDLNEIALKVGGISCKLDEMQRKNDEAEVSKLRDTLLKYYNKYKNSDGWSILEKEAFDSLLREYEKRGGNGYIHTVVVPVMNELRVID